jgi:uncharacterized protein with HEPN domain
MGRTAPERLLDALEHAQVAIAFVDGRSFSEYLTNDMLRSAVERRIEIVGEALNAATVQLPFLDRAIPEIRQIVATRHRLAHGYHDLDHEIMWSTATEELPRLVEQLRELIQLNPADLESAYGG